MQLRFRGQDRQFQKLVHGSRRIGDSLVPWRRTHHNSATSQMHQDEIDGEEIVTDTETVNNIFYDFFCNSLKRIKRILFFFLCK